MPTSCLAPPSWNRRPSCMPSGSAPPTSMDYDDLLIQWARLIEEFPDERAAQGRMFRHILIDEMQDTNTDPGRPGRGDRRRRGRQPDRGRRRRPVDLPVPRRQLRQHPQVPRTPSRRPPLPARDQLPLHPRDRRADQRLDRPQPAGVRQDAGIGPDGRGAARRAADGRRLRGGRLRLRQDPGDPRRGDRAQPDRRTLSQPSRQHPDPERAGATGDHLRGPQRASFLRAGAHQGRTGLPADRGQPAR